MIVAGAKHNVLGNNKGIHVTSQVRYPEAKQIPLPSNVEAIMSVEIGQFSPLRARDITGPVLFSKSNIFSKSTSILYGREPVFFDRNSDPFVENYDCHGAVNLNSSMQSNVPSPFRSQGNTMYLNMPGGQWEQANKLLAEDMQNTHYRNSGPRRKQGRRLFHTTLARLTDTNLTTVSRKERLKKAVAEYGSTVIVFHVGISLISLGICYTLVSR